MIKMLFMRRPITALISAVAVILGHTAINPVSAQNSSVAIGTKVINPNAVLLLVGNNQGLIIPIVTSKNSVTAGVSEKGMIIFDDSDKKVYCFDGANWNAIGGGGVDSGIPSLFNNQIFVGSSNGIATPVSISGDAAISNNGAITIVPDAITSSKIAPNTITAFDLATDLSLTTTGSITANAPGIFTGNGSGLTSLNASNISSGSLGLARLTPGGNGSVLTTVAGVPAWQNPAGITLDGLTDAAVTTPVTGQLLIHDGAGQFRNTSVTGDASLVSNGILTIANNAINTAKIADGSVANADISATAAIAGTKVSPSFGAQNISTTGTLAAGATTVSNLSVSGATTTLNAVGYTWPAAQGAANTTLTNNGTGTLAWTPALTNALPSENIFVGNGSNIATAVPLGGDASLTSSGTLTVANNAINGVKIADGSVTDADIAATAAIAGTKVSPSFGAQNITTTGSLSAGSAFLTTLTAGTTSFGSVTGGIAVDIQNGGGTGGGLSVYANLGSDIQNVFQAANNVSGFRVRGGGNSEIFNARLGVNRNPITNPLEVEGQASKTTAGGWLANSDRRIKTDIRDVDNSLEIIKRLRPVKFKYTAEWMKRNPSIKDQYYYNFIAQEYQELFPESVQGSGEFIAGDKTEILQVDTYNAQIVSIKAIQEQQKIIEAQQAQINDLKKELDEIKKHLVARSATPVRK
jgi:hypothetical protein